MSFTFTPASPSCPWITCESSASVGRLRVLQLELLVVVEARRIQQRLRVCDVVLEVVHQRRVVRRHLVPLVRRRHRRRLQRVALLHQQDQLVAVQKPVERLAHALVLERCGWFFTLSIMFR